MATITLRRGFHGYDWWNLGQFRNRLVVTAISEIDRLRAFFFVDSTMEL